LKERTRKLTFKGKDFIYDEKNRLISYGDPSATKVELREFYDKEEDMPEELLKLIEKTVEEMCQKEYLGPKEGSAEEEDSKEEQ